MTFKREELVAASEVARFAYCQRAWWYDHKVRSRRRFRWLPIPLLLPSLMVVASIILIVLGLR